MPARRRSAVIVAAGASQRMGTPKALLAWRGSTLLGYAIDQAHRAAVDPLVVVLGPATASLASGLGPGVRVCFNREPSSGRSASIRIGCAAVPSAVDAVLIQSVDQPCPAAVLDVLFEAVVAGAAVAVPVYAGRRGHPVCFAGALLRELRQVSEVEQGLRAVVRRHGERLVEVAVDDPAVRWNLNDPVAYAAARASAQP